MHGMVWTVENQYKQIGLCLIMTSEMETCSNFDFGNGNPNLGQLITSLYVLGMRF